jgi:hypothetical protein
MPKSDAAMCGDIGGTLLCGVAGWCAVPAKPLLQLLLAAMQLLLWLSMSPPGLKPALSAS